MADNNYAAKVLSAVSGREPPKEGYATALSDLAGAAFRSVVPVNIRQYASALAGGRGGISVNDLWQSDKDSIVRAALREAKTTGKTSGVIGYGDYGEQPGEFSGFGGGLGNTNPASAIYQSYTDPKFRMETAIGQARYEINPNGTVTISDQYDFNAPRKAVDAEVAKSGKFGAIANAYRDAGFEGAINAAGNIYAGADGGGQPYQITLPTK